MVQRGFWDIQLKVAKLQENKPAFMFLAGSLHGYHSADCLKKGYEQERKSKTGRKRIDPLILFKMLILKQLFNLGDEDLEFQGNNRLSFEDFVGLGVMNPIQAQLLLPSLGRDYERRG